MVETGIYGARGLPTGPSSASQGAAPVCYNFLVLAAAVYVGFVVLALACVALLGVPLGIVAWLLIYGVFRFLARHLLIFVGDSSDLTERPTRRPTLSAPVASANTRRRPPSPQGQPF